MHILITDETNLNSNEKVKFFIYGGLIIPLEKSHEINNEVNEIRKKYGYRNDDDLKFDTRSRPKNVTFENSTLAKEDIIKVCLKFDCNFIVYVALHDIIKNAKQKEIIHKGADHVIGKFNRYLFEKQSYGMCFIDRLSDTSEYKFLSTKFTEGLNFTDGTQIKLDRISLFASTCNNASHYSSIVDIVLGAFRYSINSPQNLDLAKDLMKKLVSMLWHTKNGDNIQALEKGLIFRPQNIKVEKYKKEYDNLLETLNKLISENE